jgi:hypothetical protein
MSPEQGRGPSAQLAGENRQKESAEWEKNQSRIREYLETLSPPKRNERLEKRWWSFMMPLRIGTENKSSSGLR